MPGMTELVTSVVVPGFILIQIVKVVEDISAAMAAMNQFGSVSRLIADLYN